MTMAQSMLPEFDNEMANTRKMLERIPENKFDYKPDPKSMPMGKLASHVVEMVGWLKDTIQQPSIDISPDMKPYAATSRKDLLDKFDQNAASSRAALAGVSDQAMMQEWTLKVGGNPMFSMPRVAVIRSMIMNHVIHHRAQLSVYYRMNGVPVPGMYGPSADEAMPAAAGGH